MRRLACNLRLALVGLCIGLVAVDSASACRFLSGRRSRCSSGACTASEYPSSVCFECELPAEPSPPAAEPAPPAPITPAEPAPLTPVQPRPAERAPEPAIPAPPAAPPTAPAPAPAAPPRPAPAPIPAPPAAAPNAGATPADDPFAPAPATPPAAPARRPAAPPMNEADDPFAPVRPAPRGAIPATPDEDDPFAPRPARPVSTPLAAELRLDEAGRLPMRQWTDSSGQFRVRGRLILILDGKVRLLKDTGRTTTVPLERLSDSDRQYIEQAIDAHGADLAGRLIAAR